MEKRIKEAHKRIKDIRLAMQLGDISYSDAKNKVQSDLDILNEKGREVAKKLKIKYHNITFTGIMR